MVFHRTTDNDNLKKKQVINKKMQKSFFDFFFTQPLAEL